MKPKWRLPVSSTNNSTKCIATSDTNAGTQGLQKLKAIQLWFMAFVVIVAKSR